MTQTVIGVFDTPDAADQARKSLASLGVDKSSIHIASMEDGGKSGQKGQSMDDVRDFLDEIFGSESSEDVEDYAERIKEGSVLLAVDIANDQEVESIREAMADAGVADMDQMEQGGGAEKGEGKTVPIVEEELKITKRQVSKGKVRVVSRMVETPVSEKVTLKEEHATIERRPVDKPIELEDVEAMGERTVEIQETSEKPVVSKTARVVEEVEVGKETSESTQSVEGTVRHTEVDIEREPEETEEAPPRKSNGKSSGKTDSRGGRR